VSSRLALDSWLTGVSEAHPVFRQKSMASPEDEDWLDDLDELLLELIEHGPTRLDGKRRDFRALTDRDRWDDLRAELIVARWLTRRGIDYAFGAPGEPAPDIVVADPTVGVEVTRRRHDGAAELRWAIFHAVLDAPKPKPQPLITLSAHPLAIRRRVLDAIVDAFREAAASDERTVHAVVRPQRDGYPAITAEIDFRGGVSAVPRMLYLPSATSIGPTLLDVEDVVVRALEEPRKIKQSASMPTILVIDVSVLPNVTWLRPTACGVRASPIC
jgi:hypothetical protein